MALMFPCNNFDSKCEVWIKQVRWKKNRTGERGEGQQKKEGGGGESEQSANVKDLLREALPPWRERRIKATAGSKRPVLPPRNPSATVASCCVYLRMCTVWPALIFKRHNGSMATSTRSRQQRTSCIVGTEAIQFDLSVCFVLWTHLWRFNHLRSQI